MELPSGFVDLCRREGVDLDHADDFMPWYKFWANGYNTSLRLFAVWKNREQLTAMGRSMKDELLREEEENDIL